MQDKADCRISYSTREVEDIASHPSSVYSPWCFRSVVLNLSSLVAHIQR